MRRRDERGFTLIEVLVVVSILGVIMSAITSAIITVIRTTGATAERTSQSHDSQLLSTWLVPDLQSAGSPLPPLAITKPTPTPAVACPSGDPDHFSKLELTWVDAADSTTYTATYQVTPSFKLERTLTVTPLAGSPSSETFVVVHNLADPAQPLPAGATPRYPACIEQTSDGKVTVTITTLVKRGDAQFTFRVTAQTRQPYAPPLPLGPPDPVSLDIDGDGTIDQIEVQFDQAVACVPGPCDRGNWEIGNAPGLAAVSRPDTVTVDSSDSNKVVLGLLTPAWDTKANAMSVTMVAGDLRAAAGPVPGFVAPTVEDGMAPVLVKATSQDLDSSGTLDQVTARFSEPLALGPDAIAYTLTGGPDGADVKPTAAAQSPTEPLEYTLAFPTTAAVNTEAATAKLEITASAASDSGTRVNLARAVPVQDKMAPVLDPTKPIFAEDVNTDGKVDRLVAAFTETLVDPYTAPNSKWVLTGAPSAATLSTVSRAGKLATLALSVPVGAPANTATAGFTVALDTDPGGLRDAAGNQVSFGAQPVADRMAPILVSPLTTTPGTVSGEIETNDTLTANFSEAITFATPPPVLTVDKSGSKTIFTLPGLVTVTMDTNQITTPLVTCPVTVSPSGAATVTVTVVSCNGKTEPRSATGKAAPASTLRDQASPAMAPVGLLDLSARVMF